LWEITRPFIKFIIGTGKSISLWHDWWHQDGILYFKYGRRVVYNAASSFDAKVSSVLREGNWLWKLARSKDLVNIQSLPSPVDMKRRYAYWSQI
jgi:hypothetical protein